MVSTGLQCGSPTGCSSRGVSSALAWVFPGPQLLQETAICSGSLTGNHVKHGEADEGGTF